MVDTSEGLYISKRSSSGTSSVICIIILMAYSSLFGKSSWHMMVVLVAGLPLLTTRKYFPTSTSPSTLYFCDFLGHLYLIRTEGCSIWAVYDALDPCSVRRRKVCGILFCWFSQFSRLCGVLSGPSRIIITLLFLWINPDKRFPRCLSSWRTWCEKVSVLTTCST